MFGNKTPISQLRRSPRTSKLVQMVAHTGAGVSVERNAGVGATKPPWRQPKGKWMVSLVNSHTHATSKRQHLWDIDLRFALNSTPGWVRSQFNFTGEYST